MISLRQLTRKFLIILGLIFLALLVFGGIVIGTAVVRGNGQDQESRNYADSAVRALLSTDGSRELLNRASPELMRTFTFSKVDEVFRALESFGPLQRSDPAQGQSYVNLNGAPITALYTVNAHFERRDAVITLVLIKHGGQWQILGFNVNSPQIRSPSTPSAIKA